MNGLFMMKTKETIKRLRKNETINRIHKETGLHRRTIRKIKVVAQNSGWLDEGTEFPTEAQIQKKYITKKRDQSHIEPFKEKIESWAKKGYSYVVIHKLLSKKITCSETAVRNYIKKHFPEVPKPVMIRNTVAGKHMDVDFGYLGTAIDKEGIQRKIWVFSARLRHSRKAYRQIVLTQKQEIFFKAHIYAFEYFGGVPQKVVPDNLKAGVIKSTIDNDLLNRVYQNLAEYYGFQISPCKPLKPEHKGGVENDIKYIKRNFWPIFLEEERDKGRKILLVANIQEALDRWTREVAEERIVAQVGRTPNEIFNSEEHTALLSLPIERWDPVTWSEVRVTRAWRARFDNAFYSVPYELIGQKVTVLANSTTVRIFHNYDEIALHPRATEKWQYVRKTIHAPIDQEKVLSTTKTGLTIWAEKIGPYTHKLVSQLLSHKSIDKMRAVRSILKLASKFSDKKLEAACCRALYYEALSYKSIKRMLDEGLESEPLGEDISFTQKQPKFRFVRKSTDYR